MKIAKRWVLWTMVVGALPGIAWGSDGQGTALQGRAAPLPRDRYVVSVLTFGPGDHPFLKFGHNAIRVHDRRTRSDRVYNFGTFEYASDTLIQDFLKGRLMYWVSVSGLEVALVPYEESGRSAVEMELDLTPAQQARLVRELETAAQPENRYYRYDYYRDNCSTRIRDVVDQVSGGALGRASRGPAHFNWREHTLRLTQDDLPIALGLHILLGPDTDAERTVWEEMFLPSVLEQTLARATVRRSHGGMERELPLVKRTSVLLEPRPDRRAPPQSTPTWWPQGLLLGALLGSMAVGLARGAVGARSLAIRRWFLFCLWAMAFTVGLTAAFLSGVFLLLWTTTHQSAHANQNLLAFPPWSLSLSVLALLAPFWTKATRVAWGASCLGVLSCLVGGVVLLFPHSQDTRVFLAVMLPLWLGLAAAFRRVASRP